MPNPIPNIPGAASHDYQIQNWFLEANTQGAPVNAIDFSRCAVQLKGNLGPGQCALEGRLDGEHQFIPVPAFSSESLVVGLRPGLFTCLENLMVAELRPVLLNGDADTKVKVTVLLKR